MRPLMPEEIRRAVRGRWRWPAERVAIGGVSTDTRTARAGEVFVALRGERFDGHDFLADAAAAGCACAVIAQEVEVPRALLELFVGGVIAVPDTTAALGDLASAVRGRLTASVVAVTGSNGKTTVKRMIHHILSRRLRGRAGPRSFNNAVGVPLTLFEAAGEDDYIVCEVGSNAPGEIAALARIARPDVAVITSVSPTHLERLGDVERVAMEKAALLGGVRPGGVAVVCADSAPLARALRAYEEVRIIRFGVDDSAELRLTGYEPTPGGGEYELNGRLRARLPVPGRHNALNALAAVAVAQRFGFEQDAAASALEDFAGEEMRLQPVRVGEVTVVNDAYNANPASLAAAVEALRSFPGQRRVVVAGDMLELGPAAVELHLASGREMAAAGVEVVVGVGPLGRHIAAGAAEAGGVEVHQLRSVQAAARALGGLLRAGDVVLLKGSRAMRMERLLKPIRQAFAAATGPRGGGRRARGC